MMILPYLRECIKGAQAFVADGKFSEAEGTAVNDSSKGQPIGDEKEHTDSDSQIQTVSGIDAMHIHPMSPVEPREHMTQRSVSTSDAETARLLAASRTVLSSALKELTSDQVEGGWRREVEASEEEVESSPRSTGRTAFRLTAELPGCPPRRVWDQLRADSGGAGWLLSYAMPLQTLEADVGDSGSDVMVQRSRPRLGGLVAAREFVLVRRWSPLPTGGAVLASASENHPNAPPPQSSAPRGECGAGGWLVEPSNGGGTKLRWAVECSLGGWVPERAVRAASATYMLQYAHHLRQICRQQDEKEKRAAA